MNVSQYWKAILSQDPGLIRPYFNEDAYINWHNTNEHFSVDEFIKVNCEYPGDWEGELERIEFLGDLTITVTHVWTNDNLMSFHVTSFLKINDEKIVALDEYWGDDGDAPQWRLDSLIGTKIK